MILLIAMLAIACGLLVGILPSIGASTTILLLYPLLATIEPSHLLIFYACLITAAQFSGSVVALWLGVSGEITSFPVLQERDTIIKNGQLFVALKRTAAGSAFAVVFSLCLLFAVIQYSSVTSVFLKTETIALLLVAITLVALKWAGNSVITNTILAILGVFLSLIGYNSISDSSFLTFDLHWLYAGIPVLPVLLGIYGLPMIYAAYKETENLAINSTDYSSCLYSFPISKALLFRNSIIGFMVGLVPMVGTVMSSSLAYSIQKKFFTSYPSLSALDRVTASETANNAASISVLLPLLIFGVAIQPSEAILLTILQNNGWVSSHVTPVVIALLMSFLVFACVMCYYVCVRYVVFLSSLLTSARTPVFLTLVSLLVYNIWSVGSDSALGELYLSTFVIATIVGFVLKHFSINPLPLVFMWLVGENTQDVFTRLLQLYL